MLNFNRVTALVMGILGLTGIVAGIATKTPPHKGKYTNYTLQGSEIPQIKRLTLSVVSCKGKTIKHA